VYVFLCACVPASRFNLTRLNSTLAHLHFTPARVNSPQKPDRGKKLTHKVKKSA